MFKTMLFIMLFAMIFSGCVGITSPIGKGVISKPHHNATKAVPK